MPLKEIVFIVIGGFYLYLLYRLLNKLSVPGRSLWRAVIHAVLILFCCYVWVYNAFPRPTPAWIVATLLVFIVLFAATLVIGRHRRWMATAEEP